MPDLAKPEDYSIFLLTYLASADGSFHPAEQDAIAEKINLLFPGLEQLDHRLDEIIVLIRTSGKEKAEESLLENLSVLQSLDSTRRKQLYESLFEVLNADGRVSEEEIRIVRLLKEHFTA